MRSLAAVVATGHCSVLQNKKIQFAYSNFMSDEADLI